jgi:hypothetical protein
VSFLLIGLVLVGARRALGVVETPARPLVVTIDASAGPAEIERAVDDGILADFGAQAHRPQADPAIVARLIQNMRFVDGTLSPEAALERALALGMDKTDPVVRQRMKWLAHQTLARATFEVPTDLELKTYVQEHRERFANPPRICFAQIFLSAQLRGDGLERDAAVVASELSEQRLSVEAATKLGDPSLLPQRLAWVSARRIDSLFGSGFGQQVSAATVGEWSGPLRSSFGVHFVYVEQRRDGGLPPLAQIGDQVAHELERDRRDGRVRQAVRRMRGAYEIRLEARP